MMDGKRSGDKVSTHHGILIGEERRRLIVSCKNFDVEEEEDEKEEEEGEEEEKNFFNENEEVDKILGNFQKIRQINYCNIRKRLIGLIICLFISLLSINSLTYGQFNTSRLARSTYHQENEVETNSPTSNLPTAATPSPLSGVSDSGFAVKTTGCRIPAFPVLDQNIQQYFNDISPFQCQAGTHLPLVNSDLENLIIDEAAIPHFYKNKNGVDCCWREFWRGGDNDNKITYSSTCQNFRSSIKMSKGVEFVKIECRKNVTEIYKDYHAFVPRKKSVEDRCNATLNTNINQSNNLSVLILGLDAVSRLNFHRTMPMTVAALKNLDAVEMLGYNKVADNTFPNLVPVLSGMSEDELTKRCWTSKRKHFDDCPFIWKNFSSAGYRTILGEDACGMSIFNYLKPGFKKQPTDYYLRPYCVASENDIGNTHKLNAHLCVGTRKTFDNLLSYTKKVAKHFSNDKYFALFWQASLTHDFIDYPKFGDESYRKFITDSNSEGLFNKTALIVMSDHGIRWGSFRQTYQGRVEESLPFVFIVLPKWWRDRYPKKWANLRRNSRSLTTPFDLHETLMDILNPGDPAEEENTHPNPSSEIQRGLSWFSPIPDHRDCTMAGISGHWCMCHTSKNASTNDTVVQTSAAYLINKLNSLVKIYPQCSLLRLKHILGAKTWSEFSEPSNNNKKQADPPSVDHTITIQTEPGDAIFESTIRFVKKNSSLISVGSISRLNLYGKQSSCVDDFNMRLYCYCSNYRS